jgi:hypothetical protein
MDPVSGPVDADPATGAPRAQPGPGPAPPDRPPAAAAGTPDTLRVWTASYVAVLAGAAALFGARALTRLPPPPPARVGLAVAMACLMAVAWLVPLPFAFRTKVYLDTCVLVAAVLLFDPGVAMVAAAGGTAVAHAVRRRTPAEAVFNTAQVALQAAVGGLVLGAGGRSAEAFRFARPLDAAAVLVAGAAIYLTNTVLVAGVIAIEASANPVRTWRDSTLDTARGDVLAHLAQVGLGLAAAVAADARPWAVALLVLPAVAMHASRSRRLRRRQIGADRRRDAAAGPQPARRETVRNAGFDHPTGLPG